VAVIADFTSLVVEVDVPERTLGQVHPGSPCEIVLDAFSNKRYRGVVKEIGKQINRANIERVLPEMSARVSFLREALSEKALAEKPKKVVPATAVVTRNGTRYLFLVEQGKTRLSPVTVGPLIGDSYEVVSGPPPGTKVVVRVPETLKDGQAVKEKAP
jgi:hypothetical protein